MKIYKNSGLKPALKAALHDLGAGASRRRRELFYAVSYTHLRAHETDSYLVCRLLLEKKKKEGVASEIEVRLELLR